MTKDQDDMSPERADVLMGYALEHYIKHHDVVFKKLGHARSATKQSIKELEEADSVLKKADALPDREVMDAYDIMWNGILKAFRDHGVSEDDLSRIETVLTRIPTLIKKYYDVLVEEDAVLQALITELEAPEYKEALNIIKSVQAMPDRMSGLDPKEFDLKDSVQSFIMKPPRLRDTLH